MLPSISSDATAFPTNHGLTRALLLTMTETTQLLHSDSLVIDGIQRKQRRLYSVYTITFEMTGNNHFLKATTRRIGYSAAVTTTFLSGK